MLSTHETIYHSWRSIRCTCNTICDRNILGIKNFLNHLKNFLNFCVKNHLLHNAKFFKNLSLAKFKLRKYVISKDSLSSKIDSSSWRKKFLVFKASHSLLSTSFAIPSILNTAVLLLIGIDVVKVLSLVKSLNSKLYLLPAIEDFRQWYI